MDVSYIQCCINISFLYLSFPPLCFLLCISKFSLVSLSRYDLFWCVKAMLSPKLINRYQHQFVGMAHTYLCIRYFLGLHAFSAVYACRIPWARQHQRSTNSSHTCIRFTRRSSITFLLYLDWTPNCTIIPRRFTYFSLQFKSPCTFTKIYEFVYGYTYH